MKCGRAHDAVESALERQAATNRKPPDLTCAPNLSSRCSRAERSMFCERSIPTTRPLRQRLKQLGRKPASAAAGIQHNFIPTQPQPRQHLLAPTYLWPREPVIHRRIPLAGRGLLFRCHRQRIAGSSKKSRFIRVNPRESVAINFPTSPPAPDPDPQRYRRHPRFPPRCAPSRR